ncbi:unnamed protein product [Caenorhabditis sp. 36 PRJEB53466]|nr:unnamed protein product [Caenorhabditis sp. 36 PRJEB53466]
MDGPQSRTFIKFIKDFAKWKHRKQIHFVLCEVDGTKCKIRMRKNCVANGEELHAKICYQTSDWVKRVDGEASMTVLTKSSVKDEKRTESLCLEPFKWHDFKCIALVNEDSTERNEYLTDGGLFVKVEIRIDEVVPEIKELIRGACAFDISIENFRKKDKARLDIGKVANRHWRVVLVAYPSPYPTSGFLTDQGALEVEIEIRVNAIQQEDGKTLLFNLYDPYFEDSFVFIGNTEKMYVSKTLLAFHSPVLAARIESGQQSLGFNNCQRSAWKTILQLVHGVRLNINSKKYEQILEIADRYQIMTVIRYCEGQILYFKRGFMKSSRAAALEFAEKYKMRSLLKCLLKGNETP